MRPFSPCRRPTESNEAAFACNPSAGSAEPTSYVTSSKIIRALPPSSESVKESIPLARYGDVTDIAAAAIYLASADADYVTGTTLDVNGGLFMK